MGLSLRMLASQPFLQLTALPDNSLYPFAPQACFLLQTLFPLAASRPVWQPETPVSAGILRGPEVAEGGPRQGGPAAFAVSRGPPAAQNFFTVKRGQQEDGEGQWSVPITSFHLSPG